MSLGTKIANWVVRGVFETVCRIDLPELQKIPSQGPLIVIGNHINFLEVPVVVPHLEGRPLVGLAKRESWENPLFHFLFNRWGMIPIERGEVDREAFRAALQALSQGKILAVAPEGTRSKDGCLLQGKPGIVALALRSEAPLLPVAFFGHENFWLNFKRLRRTDFHIAVGRPFRLALGEQAGSRELRQAVADEMMRKIAELLPERYRGYYQDAGKIPYQYIVDLE